MNKTEWTLDTVMVKPVDIAKMNAKVAAIYPEGEFRGTLAVIENPRLAIIDEECVGEDVASTEAPIELYVYKKDTKHADGSITGEIMPRWVISTNIPELLSIANPAISLAKFMGERKDYNNRIRINQSEWIKAFNS